MLKHIVHISLSHIVFILLSTKCTKSKLPTRSLDTSSLSRKHMTFIYISYFDYLSCKLLPIIWKLEKLQSVIQFKKCEENINSDFAISLGYVAVTVSKS